MQYQEIITEDIQEMWDGVYELYYYTPSYNKNPYYPFL